MRSLVLGRFQPLHLGHVKMVEYAADKSTFITVGVGSCNCSETADNPFTASEREWMLRESLDLKIPYELKRIPDFGDNGRWISWIMENIGFDVFMTNSSAERRIFEDADLKVESIPFFNREVYWATEVRRRILEDEDWASLLPQGTVRVLGAIDGIYRIKRLNGRA